jgi:NADPH:quinone reductase-like Zn-dependent oxidoreductase
MSSNDVTMMMKAAVCSQFGPPDDVLSVVQRDARPTASSKRTLLIQVHACSLSPGDYRGLLGDKPIVTPVPPYVVGGDVSGVVVSSSENNSEQFHSGTRIVATWDMFGTDGISEYMYVNPKFAVTLPESLTFIEGAALANSACHAYNLLQQYPIQKDERVLVLGGSGGVGTILIQLLKRAGAGYIATTSTDEPLCKSLGADRVIDYKKQDWGSTHDSSSPLMYDVIYDCAEGQQAWEKCKSILKPAKEGGRFVGVVLQDWYVDGKTWFNVMVKFMLPLMMRQWWNALARSTKNEPRYYCYMQMANQESLQAVMDLAEKQEIRVVIDSVHPFTTQGVRDAFNRHIARAGHGKIVVKIADD